jgi:hypothetical protein
MSDALHSALTGTNIHVAHRFTYANTATREAASPGPGDVGCLALQQDDDSLWLLTDDDPVTWVALAGEAAPAQLSAINIVIDGSGEVITTGVKCDVEIPFDCVIQRATLLADQAGSIVLDLWSAPYANFPPTDADSITGATPPELDGENSSQDLTLTDWTTYLYAEDILRVNVDSATTVERVTLSILVERV